MSSYYCQCCGIDIEDCMNFPVMKTMLCEFCKREPAMVKIDFHGRPLHDVICYKCADTKRELDKEW